MVAYRTVCSISLVLHSVVQACTEVTEAQPEKEVQLQSFTTMWITETDDNALVEFRKVHPDHEVSRNIGLDFLPREQCSPLEPQFPRLSLDHQQNEST